MEDNNDKDVRVILQDLAKKIVKIRKRPLLLMYYSDRACTIKAPDLDMLEKIFYHDLGEKKLKNLDIILYTRGGDVNASYLLAQLIRHYCDSLNMLIPFHCYSGGTLIALASNTIEMGATSKLSPIDIQIGLEEEQLLPLLNFEKYIEFIEDSCKTFKFREEKNKTAYITPLIVEFVKILHPLQLGETFRARTLTGYYAKMLLMEYMFKNHSEKSKIADSIIVELTTKCPIHNFDIDFKIANKIGLNVKYLNTEVYILGKKLVNVCSEAERLGHICSFINEEKGIRQPYFQLFLDAR